jgi:hypothetical protein
MLPLVTNHIEAARAGAAQGQPRAVQVSASARAGEVSPGAVQWQCRDSAVKQGQ